ncbi:hypothetical protein D3C76_1024130 [compost metagenome]
MYSGCMGCQSRSTPTMAAHGGLLAFQESSRTSASGLFGLVYACHLVVRGIPKPMAKMNDFIVH